MISPAKIVSLHGSAIGSIGSSLSVISYLSIPVTSMLIQSNTSLRGLAPSAHLIRSNR